ncbi:dihydrolipoyl dehydrogenase family protein [Hyphomonas johnsonii]|uniref:Pyridine nucleotide-disulfide oxidoreductase n=1 Tax=Hyphomonas johnsonii MHS-2 TaxID=1280950 RepID=A0A059FNK3_9PROT|nr:FAD-dependent oxidoreductase [Hyphomonas johnsonii]KCZ92091.1 pyridine nucleotide-disulfide oxidoreductase [Hyphomonas johnsonii MHS-2]
MHDTKVQVKDYKADLVVIGGGSGGLSAAAGAAMFGLNVVLYEQAEMGGDCLNYGCVPSKALLSAAKAAQSAREAAKYGIGVSAPVTDWAAVKAHVRHAIDTIAPVDSQERFEGLGVTVIREHARFADPDTVVSANTRTRARRIVVATGSTAFIPPIEGLKTVPYVTNETLFSMPDFPEHLVILGGGPIGLEMAQAFTRLGARTTVIEMGLALGKSDPAHAAIAIGALRDEGVTVLEGHKAVRVSSENGGIRVHTEHDGAEVPVDGSHLLVAVGRRTMLDGLDLEAGKVEFDRKGIVVGDTLRSRSNRRVWALGDSAGREQFTHVAGWHASVFARRAFFKQRTKADSLPIPAVTYTSPEVAQVALTEAEAREKFGDSVETSSFPFHENDRAIAEGKTLGEAKLVIRKGKLLGASIVGEGAGDILQIISLAMSNGLKVQDLTNFISPYPTRAEVVKRAASAHFTEALFSKSAKRLVGLLQRIP